MIAYQNVMGNQAEKWKKLKNIPESSFGVQHMQDKWQYISEKKSRDLRGFVLRPIFVCCRSYCLGHGRLIFSMADLWRAIFVESVGR